MSKNDEEKLNEPEHEEPPLEDFLFQEEESEADKQKKK